MLHFLFAGTGLSGRAYCHLPERLPLDFPQASPKREEGGGGGGGDPPVSQHWLRGDVLVESVSQIENGC